tara:strand:+ start:304 stop:1611 length:1308 start_codon:yes stop_codon:yes gene_type:complete
MSICIIGLGKLGYPMAEFLSSSGLSINCYDHNEKLVLDLKKGINPLEFEKGLSSYRKNGNKLNYFLNIHDALEGSEICFITVTTPSNPNGSFSNANIISVLEKISSFLKNRKKGLDPFVININSTLSPGSISKELIPFLESAGLKNNVDFIFIYNPYFVALGDVVEGLESPDLVLIGHENKFGLNKLLSIYNKIYHEDSLRILNFKEAELTKLLVNSFLTLKISFSNMVKDIIRSEKNINVSKILATVGSDSRIGKKFLKAGGPYSGPCLPRDNLALKNFSDEKNFQNYLNDGIINTNVHTFNLIKDQIKLLKNYKINSIIFAGIGYKPNTPSLEESFVIDLVNFASSKNIKVYYYDEYITQKIKNCTRIESSNIEKYSNLIFLPYVDKKFYTLANFKGYIWDIWHQIEGDNVIRNISEINKTNIQKSNIINYNF